MPKVYYNIYVGMVVYKPKTQQILDSCPYNLEIRDLALIIPFTAGKPKLTVKIYNRAKKLLGRVR